MSEPALDPVQRHDRVTAVALTALVILGVVIVSFLPGRDKLRLHTMGRYHSWGHLIAFAVVGYVAARVGQSERLRIALFVAVILFGLGIEFGEHLVFHSMMEWKDVLVDTFGAGCGTLLVSLTSRRELT